MKSVAFIVPLLAVPLLATAQSSDDYTCTMGDLTRRVAIEREGAAAAPCEVAYYKESEAPGQREVLWNARNDGSYCGARLAEFITRLEGWGWDCTARNEE